jgi:hypothetical protein
MKNLLQKWLGISDVYSRVRDVELRLYAIEMTPPPSDLSFPDGQAVRPRGIWEHVYAIMRHLKVIPQEIWEDDTSVAPLEHPKVRKLILKDEPMFAYRIEKKKKKMPMEKKEKGG